MKWVNDYTVGGTNTHGLVTEVLSYQPGNVDIVSFLLLECVTGNAVLKSSL